MGLGVDTRLGPFPLRIEYAFFLVVIIIGLSDLRPPVIAAWIVLAFLSVLLHELGHAVAFRAFGSPASIRLWAGGGLTIGTVATARRHIVVSAAGPATGIVIGLAILLVAGYPRDSTLLSHAVVRDAVFINLLWAGFNLLPALPMDGGNILAAALHLATHGGGRRLAHQISILVLLSAAVGCFVLHLPFATLLCIMLVGTNAQLVRRFDQVDLTQVVRAGLDSLEAGRVSDARTAAATVFDSRRASDGLRTAAAQLQAWADLAEGDIAGAEGRLSKLAAGATEGDLLRCALNLAGGKAETAAVFVHGLVTCTENSLLAVATSIGLEHCDPFAIGSAIDDLPRNQALRVLSAYEVGLHSAGYFDIAAEIGAHLFMLTDNAQSAYNAACSYARAGDPNNAILMLRAALFRGVDPRRIETEPHLASLRGIPDFEQLRPA